MSASPAGIPDVDGAVASPQLFVINLCASTSPMALSHPDAPELKRYTFFVSRQREEGRERFRLHMGYFASQEEADRMLELVRDVYPAAWAGPAPTSGSRRRNRTASIPNVVAAAPVAIPATAAGMTPVVTDAPLQAPAQDAAAPAMQTEVLSVMSNVRDVLAQLSDKAIPVLDSVSAAAETELTLPQILGVLEGPVAGVAAPMPAAVAEEPEVRLVTPEDTQTLTDIRLDAQNNAPPCFAVQLVWSVSPIDVASLPHLAIFDAFTLYNVEGNRQGRKWYGVRLGFFSDANSATQVANYVRSDYRAVAIVPVAIKERDGAGGRPEGEKKAAVALRAGDTPRRPDDSLASDTDLQGFELLADDRPAAKRLDLDDKQEVAEVQVPVAMPAMPAVARGVAPSADTARTAALRKAADKLMGKPSARPTGRPTGKRVQVRKRPVQLSGAAPGAPTPLESTLEILGASTLTLDEGRAIINDSAVRKPLQKKSPGGNRFARLLSRLSGN